MKVLILGAGRVGGSLATALVNNNYDVSIVDFDKSEHKHSPFVFVINISIFSVN